MTVYQVYFTEDDSAPTHWASFTSLRLAKQQLEYIVKDYIPYNYKPEVIYEMERSESSVVLSLTMSTGHTSIACAYILSLVPRKSILTI